MTDINDTLTPDDVVAAYRVLLGRRPESDDVIRYFVGTGSLDRVRDEIVSSTEYAERIARDPHLCPPLRDALQTRARDRLAARRMEHLERLGLDWSGRDVLCCGIGSPLVPSFFADRLGQVLWIDDRPDAVEAARRQIPDFVARGRAANVRVEWSDFDRETITRSLVVSYDTVFVLGNLGTRLASLCAAAKDMLVLDCSVVLRDDPTINYSRFPGTAEILIPTRASLLAELAKLMPYVHLPTTQPRDALYPIRADTDQSGRVNNIVLLASRCPFPESPSNGSNDRTFRM